MQLGMKGPKEGGKCLVCGKDDSNCTVSACSDEVTEAAGWVMLSTVSC